jgi:quercetin dioxygenase-like cupin family protein
LPDGAVLPIILAWDQGFRSFGVKIIHLKDVPRNPVDMEGAKGVFKQLPLGSADGSPGFSFRVFSVEPGGHTPLHSHPFEHLNYVIEGRGAIVDESGEERALNAGCFALVPAGEIHRYKNTSGDGPFVMICAVPVEYE